MIVGVRQWWGYMRSTGEVVLRQYRGGEEVRAACGETGVLHVRGPFLATEAAAAGMLKSKLAIAKSQATMRRLLESKPEKLLTLDDTPTGL